MTSLQTITFSDFLVSADLKRSIEALKYETPTPIQEAAIPVGLQKRDILGKAQTGTGKTAAFAVPVIEHVNPNDKNVQALILCPTRELAIQVTREVKKLYKFVEGVKAVSVYGGQSYDIQLRALKSNPQIVVGTPGRIIDLMDRNLLKFDHVETLVLDEADEMLKMGFQDDLEKILNTTPKTRQTMMFSATLPKPILKVAATHLKNYELIEIESEHQTVDNIEQGYFLVKEEQKRDLFIRLFDFHQLNSAIIFMNTKKGVDELAEHLQSTSYMSAGLHGDLKQAQRDRVMNSFRNRSIQVLLATDVAARGLDIDDVDAVFNYDLPQEEEIYVHRIGRTGRAGKSGKSFTFVTRGGMYQLRNIEKYIGQSIPKGVVPSIEDIQVANKYKHYDLLKERLNATANQTEHALVTKLLEEGHTQDDLIRALFSIVNKENIKEYSSIDQIEERLIRENKSRNSSRNSRNSRDGRSRGSRDDNTRRSSSRNDSSSTRSPRSDRNDRSTKSDSRSRTSSKDRAPKAASDAVNTGPKTKVLIYNETKSPLTVAHILSAVKNQNVKHKEIGNIEIYNKGAIVEVPKSVAERMVRQKTIECNKAQLPVGLA